MADQYDAFDTDERPRSAYMSRKDWRIALIALAIGAAILFPVFRYMARQSESYRCGQNFQQINSALGVYMASNNDRYPPAFIESEPGQPALFEVGDEKAPFTWMTLLRSAMEERADFVCPSAKKEENSWNVHPEKIGERFGSTYGIYLPRSGWPQSMIQNPDDAVLIAETSNQGAAGSYDPLKLEGPYDGMVIAWNDSNLKITPDSKFVTRLAFPGSSDGTFTVNGPARHDHGIYALMASGRRRSIGAGEAAVSRLGESAQGLWADR